MGATAILTLIELVHSLMLERERYDLKEGYSGSGPELREIDRRNSRVHKDAIDLVEKMRSLNIRCKEIPND